MEELESKTAKLKVFQGKQIVFVKFRKSNYVDSSCTIKELFFDCTRCPTKSVNLLILQPTDLNRRSLGN